MDNEGGYSIRYESNRKIDGFDVFGVDYDNAWEDYGIEVSATLTKPDPLAPQLFDRISTQLEQLKNEGYVLKPYNKADNETLKSFIIKKESGVGTIVKISLLKDNYIRISFDKYGEYVSTLSPNFYKQFKAILNASWKDVRGSLTDTEDNGDGIKSLFYTSKKALDRFTIEAMEDNKGNNKFVQAYINSYYPNVHLYSLIRTELSKLKNEGYNIVQGDGASVGLADVAKMTSLYKGEKLVAEADLNKDSSIVILVAFPTQSKLSTNTIPTGEAGLVWFTSSTSKSKPEYGLMDSLTQMVIKAPTYTTVSDFSDGLALVSFIPAGYNRRTQYGYIDKTGKEAFPFTDKWTKAHSFSEGLAAVWGGIAWEFINKTGEVVIGFVSKKKAGYLTGLNAVLDFNEGIAAVNYYGKWGFIDKTGKFIIKAQYDKAESFINGKAKVKKGTQEFFIDKAGNVISENTTGDPNSEGWFVGGQSQFGLRDANGNILIQPKYLEARPFKEDWAAVAVKSSYGTPLWFFVDRTGKEIAQSNSKDIKGNLGYGEVSDFSEGLAAVKGYGGKWGFVDKTGKEVIKLQYENVNNFEDGIAWVEYKGDWGLIDKTGKILLPFCYNQAISLGEGLYKVKYNYEKLKNEAKKYDALKEVMGKQSVSGVTKGYILDGGIIDKTGKELENSRYQDIKPFSEGLAAAKGFSGLWRYIDATGKEVIGGHYQVAGDFIDGKAKVTDDRGREFYIDKTGKELK